MYMHMYIRLPPTPIANPTIIKAQSRFNAATCSRTWDELGPPSCLLRAILTYEPGHSEANTAPRTMLLSQRSASENQAVPTRANPSAHKVCVRICTSDNVP